MATTTDNKIDKSVADVEGAIKSIVIDSEYSTGKANKGTETADFEAIIDLLESVRTEKNADWRSDIFIPQFFSQIITQASTDASQYFQNRDFVEAYVMSGDKVAASDASERLINRTLNQNHLRHYHKYMRSKMIVYLKGETYCRFWWEKEFKTITQPSTDFKFSTEIDIEGNLLGISPDQQPAVISFESTEDVERIVKDRFNYDVIDPRNIFMDNNYVYSLQDKEWIIIRFEITVDKIESQAKQNNYFNLDKLRESPDSKSTETSDETYNSGDQGNTDRQTKPDKTPSKYFDKIERFGKFWVVVEETNNRGFPVKVKPGIDSQGVQLEDAELIECLITFAVNASVQVLIGFEPQQCRDSEGNQYRPIGRGLQYIHPTEDSGIGDGKPSQELQVAINDTFNINNDRVMLATLPTFKGKKYGNEDNSTIRFEPEHIIELDDPTNDLQEIKIEDNMAGANIQMSFLKGMMEQVMAQSPGTMGILPQDSSTTATAIAGAEARTNIRSNYKNFTYENTLLCDMYWIILQLTWQYAEEETAIKLLGENMADFDPVTDYFYKPVSQSIETEYSKTNKVKLWLQTLSYVAQIPNPNTARLLNFIISKIATLMGDEFDVIAKALLDPNAPIEGVTGQQETIGGAEGAASNQNNVPISGMEANTRESQGVFA